MKYAKKIDTYLRMIILHPKLDGIIAISRFLYDYYRSKHCNVVEIPPLIDAEESKWNNSFCFHEGRYELVYAVTPRSEEHTSELQSLMRISYAVFCLQKKKNSNI